VDDVSVLFFSFSLSEYLECFIAEMEPTFFTHVILLAHSLSLYLNTSSSLFSLSEYLESFIAEMEPTFFTHGNFACS